jgi:TetR/AcrR family transcriptional repressor of nem operon
MPRPTRCSTGTGQQRLNRARRVRRRNTHRSGSPTRAGGSERGQLTNPTALFLTKIQCAGRYHAHSVISAYAREGLMLDMATYSSGVMTPRGRATHARSVGAGVSGSQVTHYFEDKRALVRGVIAWRRDELVSLHTQGELTRLDSFQALQDWADINVQFQVDNNCFGGCIFGSLVGELLPTDEDIRADLVAVYDEWIALLRAALAAMRARGELRLDADPRHLARVLVAAQQGGSQLAQLSGSVKPLQDAVNAAVQYVFSFAAQPVEITSGGSRAVGEGADGLTVPRQEPAQPHCLGWCRREP